MSIRCLLRVWCGLHGSRVMRRGDKEVSDVRSAGEHSCQICYDQDHSTAMLPCGHGGLCWDCGLQIYALTEECPMCRTKIEVVRTPPFLRNSSLTVSAGYDSACRLKALPCVRLAVAKRTAYECHLHSRNFSVMLRSVLLRSLLFSQLLLAHECTIVLHPISWCVDRVATVRRIEL